METYFLQNNPSNPLEVPEDRLEKRVSTVQGPIPKTPQESFPIFTLLQGQFTVQYHQKDS